MKFMEIIAVYFENHFSTLREQNAKIFSVQAEEVPCASDGYKILKSGLNLKHGNTGTALQGPRLVHKLATIGTKYQYIFQCSPSRELWRTRQRN
jgi:hypothetical protein